MRYWLLLLGLVLLSGCVSQQQQTEFNPDASGSYEIRLGFSQQFLDFAEMGGGGASTDVLDDALGELGSIAELLPAEWQATNENWTSEDGQYRGTLIRMQFRDLAMLKEQLTSAELNELYSLVRFEDVAIEQNGNEINLRATIKNGQNSMLGSEETGELFGSGLVAGPTTSWTIRFPNTISTWNEREIATLSDDQTSITYDFPYPLSRDYQIELVGNLSAGVPQWAMWVVGGLVGIGIVLVGVGFILSRRKTTQPYDVVPAGLGNGYPAYQAGSQTTPLAAPSYQPKPENYQPNDNPALYQPKPEHYQPNDSVSPYAPKPEGYQAPAPAAELSNSYEQPTKFGSVPSELGGRTPTRSLGSWQDPNDQV